MKRKLSATIYIYGIFFNNSRYCYIGSTNNPAARYAGHLAQLRNQDHVKFMQNVYNKHGIRKFVVFKQTTTELGRLELEQKYFDFFAKHGYHLVNAITPKQSTESYEFAGMQEHRHMLSKASRKRWNRQVEHEKVSAATVAGMACDAVRAKISAGCKRAHVNNANYTAMYANAERNANVANGLRRAAAFRHKYGSSTVYRYNDTIGKFRNWMHFIIVNDIATVFVWDTRKVLFQCNVSDLPEGYNKARHETYNDLIFENNETKNS